MKLESKYYKHCLLAFAFVSMAVQVCFAQIEFTEHTIADNFDGAYHVFAIDLDGDGDMDVLG
ncbi:VCBS repeat-containing protein, partial [bacterium]|nr:VCBS repeat-containing protein [bacterium]